MSVLAALLTQILFLGQMPGTPQIAEQVAAALQQPARAASDLSTALPILKGVVPDHLILTAAGRTAPELAALQAAAAAIGSPKVWLLEGWPDTPLSTGWTAEIPAQTAAWQASAAGLGAGLIPSATLAGQMIGQLGPQALGADGAPDDRAFYAAALSVTAALGGDVSKVPDRLVRRWMRRDSVVTPEYAAAVRLVALDQPAVAAVSATASLPEGGVTAPGIGFGLAPVNDWTVQQPFLDVMKTARPWQGHRGGQWGAVSFADLQSGGHIGPEGWPRSLPPGVTGLASLVLTDLPPEAGGLAGRYRVTWSGEGSLGVIGRAQNVHHEGGALWFDFTPGPGGVELVLRSVNPDNPLRDIVILRGDRIAAWEAGAVFNPDWLSRLRGTKVIRFMDWMQANSTTQSALADLPQPGDFSWAWRGTPPEIMVALANELQAEPWFTLPWKATPELHSAYAQVVHQGLDPNLRAWIEYTNEAWNMIFPQAKGLEEEARARWGQEWKWMQLYGLRAAEMVAAWNAVFADQPERLVRVLSSQTAWMGLEDDLLAAPLLVAEGLAPPVQVFDAWAVSGYFSAGVGHPEKAGLLTGWLAESRAAAEQAGGAQGLTGAALEAHVSRHRFDLAVERALEDLRDGRHSGEKLTALEGLLGEQLPWHARVAARHNLDLVMYEGGTHAVGQGPLMEDAEVTAFLAALSYSAGMGEIYRDLLDGWKALTPQPFLAYVDVMAPSRFGNWGALRHLWDDNPRWRALTTGTRGE